ncbi:hypothetical protein HDU96_005618, partial [Phlyctochytrium bullatum]
MKPTIPHRAAPALAFARKPKPSPSLATVEAATTKPRWNFSTRIIREAVSFLFVSQPPVKPTKSVAKAVKKPASTKPQDALAPELPALEI